MGKKKDTHNYTTTRRPITVDVVKEEIIRILKKDNDVSDEQINHPEVQSVIEEKVNQIMYSMWDDINYLGENHEDKIYDIIDKVDELNG